MIFQRDHLILKWIRRFAWDLFSANLSVGYTIDLIEIQYFHFYITGGRYSKFG